MVGGEQQKSAWDPCASNRLQNLRSFHQISSCPVSPDFISLQSRAAQMGKTTQDCDANDPPRRALPSALNGRTASRPPLARGRLHAIETWNQNGRENEEEVIRE